MSSANLAHSVRDRLAERARSGSRPYQELLEYYAMERFLYRLSRSPHAERFVLKGALMLRVWEGPAARPTRDVDLLGRTGNSLENLADIVRSVCAIEVEPDALEFRADSVRATRIKEDADYAGVRVLFEARLGKSKVAMQIDVAFGDVMVPGAQRIEYPTLLDLPAPILQGYPRASVVAEKFEAMVKLGTLNSRMKDFYDVWFLARRFDFEGPELSRALAATFEHRGTPLDPSPIAFESVYTEGSSARAQWAAFVRRGGLGSQVPETLAAVVVSLSEFLGPVARATLDRAAFPLQWRGPGPWRSA